MQAKKIQLDSLKREERDAGYTSESCYDSYVDATRAVDDCTDIYNSYSARNLRAVKNQRHSAWQSAKSKVTNIQNQITSTRKPPQFIKNPLPQNDDGALTCLFFLFMPESLRILCRLIYNSCIRMADPSSLKTQMSNKFWSSHYSLNGKYKPHTDYNLYLLGPDTPDRYGPDDVEKMFDACIWHPAPKFSFFWTTTFPEVAKITSYFTETLPGKSELDWLNKFPTLGNRVRGNLPFADLKEKELEKTRTFLAKSMLRSYPFQGIRRLMDSLHLKTLNLADKSVQILIRQTLFQIGDLMVGDEVVLKWKSDLENNGVRSFQGLLVERASEMRESPKEFETFYIQSRISSFMYSHVNNFDVIISFRDCALNWVKTYAFDSVLETEQHVAQDRGARRALFYGLAIFAHFLVHDLPTSADAGLLLISMLQFNDNLSYFKGSAIEKYRLELARLVRITISNGPLESLIDFCHSNGDIITKACQSISGLIPNELKWEQLNNVTGCFHSTFEGTHYAVNVMNGIFLINGRYFSLLPLI